MPKRQTPAQKETIERVIHEFKEGELRTGGNGPKVKNPKQAIAIALHEAGATNQEPPKKNTANLRKTKAKERNGETAQAASEGKSAQDRTLRKGSGRGSGAEKSKTELYDEAKRRSIPGRSKMTGQELERALF